MSRGIEPVDFYQTPASSQDPDEFYRILDAFTWETFADDEHEENRVGFVVPLPPLGRDGAFTKGLLYSSSVDLLQERLPVLGELFILVANSMWTSYPWSTRADAYFVCYDNPRRMARFRAEHPQRAHVDLLPLQDADFTNEYAMAPRRGVERDIDLLCVSRFHSLKNIPLIASALKIHRRKYPADPIRMTLIGGKSDPQERARLSQMEREQYAMLDRILERPEDYIHFVDHVDHHEAMPRYYSRAQAVVLGSLLEGKSRCINEALSCDVPVICFEALNIVARGDAPILEPEAGLTCAYDAESLADAIHHVRHHPHQFRPRASYLRSNGRRNFLANSMKAIPYFSRSMPEFDAAQPLNNPWLDLAVSDNYDMSMHDFLYGRKPWLSHASGLERAGQMATFYAQKFEL